jgi:hypothetical protein
VGIRIFYVFYLGGVREGKRKREGERNEEGGEMRE